MSKKIDIAVAIVEKDSNKATAIGEIMNALGVTKSNAYIYFTKALARVGAPAVTKVAAMPKSKARANPITGLSATKAKIKVAEIDRSVAAMVADGPRSPFAGL